MNKKFDVLDFFFDWNGRIGRKDFWFGSIALSIVTIPFAVSTMLAITSLLYGFFNSANYVANYALAVASLSFIFLSVLSFAQIVLYIKRYHDRNKSGHWLWIMFIPYIGGLWLLIEAGFFSGTDGENKFGRDTLKEN